MQIFKIKKLTYSKEYYIFNKLVFKKKIYYYKKKYLKEYFLPDLLDLVKNTYHNFDNFLLEVNNQELKKQTPVSQSDKPLVAIYFSSNGLYFPCVKDVFENEILNKNKFEFYKSRISFAKYHLFLRDINLVWYKNGINYQINDIEKLLQFIKNIFKEKDVEYVCVGGSAGGYAAILIGCLLNAKYVFCSDPQICISKFLSTLNKLEPYNHYLHNSYKNFRENIENYKYNDLTNIIKNSITQIFYLFSSKSPLDNVQYELINNISNIHILKYLSYAHGAFDKDVIPYLINLKFKDLIKLFDNNTLYKDLEDIQKRLKNID